MKSFINSLIIVITFLILMAGAHAAPSDPAPLPPAAQEALNKGIIAAKVPDYLLAIRYFEEARKLAPQAPVIYLNLGLAESRIPSRELRAIAWFGAYLAAYPDAPNAAAVKEQIDVLEVRAQSNVSRFIKTVQDAANQLSDKDGDQSSGLYQAAGLWLDSGDLTGAQITADLIRHAGYKSKALLDIAKAKIEVGDSAGAKKTMALALKSADLIDREPAFGLTSAAYKKSERLADIASAQANAGDIAAARKTSDLIENKFAYDKGRALRAIAEAQIKAGDIEGAQKTLASAQKTADLMTEWAYGKRISQSAIAEVQIKAGDMAGAQKTLASALKTADLIENAPREKSMAQSAIAEAQTRSGDIPGALKTLAAAQEAAHLIKAAADKSIAWTFIAEAQAKAGDIAGAKKSLASAQNFAELIQGESYGKSWAQSVLAEAQARGGDIAGAQKNADLIQDTNLKRDAQKVIDAAQTRASNTNATKPAHQSAAVSPTLPVIQVSDWLKKLDEGDKINDCPLNTGPFLDLAGHLKSLPPSNDPEKVFNALHETAEKIVKAQNVIMGMLKQLAKR